MELWGTTEPPLGGISIAWRLARAPNLRSSLVTETEPPFYVANGFEEHRREGSQRHH